MNTRKIGGIGVLTLVLAIGGVVAFAQQGQSQEKKGTRMEHNEAMRACAKVCADCQLQCDSCFTHCLTLLADGKKEHAKSAQLCTDCAECCKTCSTLCARQSPLTRHMLECCALCCDDCASACEKSPDDKHMTVCAKSCRDCAKECREMVKHLSK